MFSFSKVCMLLPKSLHVHLHSVSFLKLGYHRISKKDSFTSYSNCIIDAHKKKQRLYVFAINCSWTLQRCDVVMLLTIFLYWCRILNFASFCEPIGRTLQPFSKIFRGLGPVLFITLSPGSHIGDFGRWRHKIIAHWFKSATLTPSWSVFWCFFVERNGAIYHAFGTCWRVKVLVEKNNLLLSHCFCPDNRLQVNSWVSDSWTGEDPFFGSSWVIWWIIQIGIDKVCLLYYI